MFTRGLSKAEEKNYLKHEIQVHPFKHRKK